MEWIQRRAGLIGVGAVVVAVVAIVVALVSGHSDRHRVMFRVAGAPFARKLVPGPFGGNPMQRGFATGPQLVAPGGPLARRFAGPGTAGALLGALHGEFTVPTMSGKYQTVDTQRGTVSKVGAGELTVRSSDGFSKTYAISGSLANGVANGDDVEIAATVSGGKATVIRLLDLRSTGKGAAPVPYGVG
ncbi:MAG TPA: hypothetical protein VG650_04750 [Mycobacteriales bacterium]|nr:hypothetical protein [Mycobacteriales bacterium]